MKWEIYFSPHSFLFRTGLPSMEKELLIQNYKPIGKRDIEEIIKNNFGDEDYSLVGNLNCLTALAFKWFKDRQIDIAVMEVGMGGL